MNLPVGLTALARCPDCDSEAGELIEIAPGFWSLEVRHDPTCPRLNAMTANQGDENR